MSVKKKNYCLLAKWLNMDYIWVHSAFNGTGKQHLPILARTNSGHRRSLWKWASACVLPPSYGDRLCDGIFQRHDTSRHDGNTEIIHKKTDYKHGWAGPFSQCLLLWSVHTALAHHENLVHKNDLIGRIRKSAERYSGKRSIITLRRAIIYPA